MFIMYLYYFAYPYYTCYLYYVNYLPQHFLYFFPLPQGQGALRPIFFTVTGCACKVLIPVFCGPLEVTLVISSFLSVLCLSSSCCSSLATILTLYKSLTVSNFISSISSLNRLNASFLNSTSGSLWPIARNPIPSFR